MNERMNEWTNESKTKMKDSNKKITFGWFHLLFIKKTFFVRVVQSVFWFIDDKSYREYFCIFSSVCLSSHDARFIVEILNGNDTRNYDWDRIRMMLWIKADAMRDFSRIKQPKQSKTRRIRIKGKRKRKTEEGIRAVHTKKYLLERTGFDLYVVFEYSYANFLRKPRWIEKVLAGISPKRGTYF